MIAKISDIERELDKIQFDLQFDIKTFYRQKITELLEGMKECENTIRPLSKSQEEIIHFDNVFRKHFNDKLEQAKK